jgi:hypothetical protein
VDIVGADDMQSQYVVLSAQYNHNIYLNAALAAARELQRKLFGRKKHLIEGTRISVRG